MAKIIPLHGQMSGSIGDNTYAHNKGGPYVRRRAVPTQPASEPQAAVRAILASLAASWQNLTDSQRAAWTDWAALHPQPNALGVSIQLTGISAFCQLNSRLLGAGDAANDDPPVGGTPALLTITSVTATSPATVEVAFTPTPLAAGHRLMVWQSLPGSAGRNPNFNQARLIGYGALVTPSPASFTTRFPFATDDQFNVWVADRDAEGRMGVPQLIRATGI